MVQHRHAQLVATVALGVGGVVAAALTMPSSPAESAAAPAETRVAKVHDAVAKKQAASYARQVELRADRQKYGKVADFLRRESGKDGGHTHNDSSTKNAISRSEEATSKDAADPTTPAQAARARAAAAEMRTEPTPSVTATSLRAPRHTHPRTRYEMAGGCYAFQAVSNGKWLRRTADGVAATAGSAGATPVRYHATDLGSYMLYGTRRDFLDGSGTAVSWGTTPGATGDWTVRRTSSGRFTFKVGDGWLTAARSGKVSLSPADAGAASRFLLTRVKGCPSFPDVAINITGGPYKGVTSFQQTYGTADAHTHGMAFEFLGGALHCGKPWDRYGVTVALKDCPDHEETNGYGAVVEDFLSGRNPGTGHDPVGWPTFKDWPAPHSLTHEGTYYRWMERAWRGGLRVFTNLLVENNKLCQLYPLKSQKVLTKNPTCDDMKTLAFEKDDMYALQRYVDAQYGGPGRGWYRIVTNPFQARRVINSGRLAVVMGIETSIPFECSVKPNPVPGGDPMPDPGCDSSSVDGWLDTVHKWGVRQMELVNKFDNAFSGITGDEGTTGVLVNSANFLETGSAWRMEHCDGKQTGFGDEVHDKDQIENPSSVPGSEQFPAEQQDALFGAVAKVAGVLPLSLPVYPPPHHCNTYGLSSLGEHLITKMAQRGMLFDPDHMSVKARKKSLDVMEKLRYPGVLSSHSWSTPDAYPRILKLGGFVAPYAGDSKGFVDKWKRLQTWTDPRYFFGVGYGADINGLGAQGDPRNPTGADKVTYPFTGFGGVTVDKQVSGKRVYDINTDGVAHYGLYPDWLQDLKMQAGSAITADMGRGAEAYLQTWERAVGVSNDACRQPSVRKPVRLFRSLRLGSSVTSVLLAAGQPHTRLDHTFGYCAKRSDGTTTRLRLTFSDAGRLQKVT
ncbi:hypothetical protein [Nocardioides marmoribigeumensis]|uniref:Peptidase n=1 Tax=Nocardioides marmoribigeumensis TaxID=433649 RepID=A0ABU2BVD9_9ACTN|nr:hypothetical protein [Nocardioides marmoribigeumensis]MDR7362607.1 hypothetical protein [Nocardioides marmoribigeumensis]